MSQPTTTPSPTSFAARCSVQYLIAVGSIVAVGVLAIVILHRKAPEPSPAPPVVDERLRDVIAQLDQTDPHWRFADLVKDRGPAPDDRVNPALIMRAAATLLPRQLNMDADDARKGLRNGTIKDRKPVGLDAAKATLEDARTIRPLGRGRHPVDWNLKNPLMTKLPHIRTTIDMVDLLTLDAEMRAHEGKMDEALESIQAALVAARTVSDEPMMASQYQRPGFHQLCARALEESLRLGQASRDNLRSVELALLAEADEPWLKFAARGERAGLHGLMNALEHGSINRADWDLLGRRAEGVSLILTSTKPPPLQQIHAALLEYTTQFIQILDLPPQQQPARLKELANTLKETPHEVLPLLNALPTIDLVQASQNGQAALRCAAVGMALERSRLAIGRWPETLDDLVAKHILEKIPADPFDGKPLRYEKSNDGVVVYASGPAAKDGAKPGAGRFVRRDDADPSFRLWNVEARPKPAT